MLDQLWAWCVHLFTASGIVVGFFGLLAATEQDWRSSLLCLLLCQFIDGVDGALARLVKVDEVLPRVHGKDIDFIIDFFNYVVLPAYLFYGWVEMSWPLKITGACLMLLSSALYYGIEGMVSPSGKYFVGFPAMWNMVVYTFICVTPNLPNWAFLGIILLLAILHFVPIYFPYPSKLGRWGKLTLLATATYIIVAGINIWSLPTPIPFWQGTTLFLTAYFGVLTAVITYQVWGKKMETS